MKFFNFFAGPSVLPESVILQAQEAIQHFGENKLSILEISHRIPDFIHILEEATLLVKELMGIDDSYEVLFLSGGSSLHYLMSAMNLLPEGGRAAYVDTGRWSRKAITTVQSLGGIDVVASSEDTHYDRIPKDIGVSPEHAYLHITTNNTVYGTQYHSIPDVETPIVADMCSDIMSREIEIDRYGVIYASAQKNMGTAGTTVVIVRKDLLGKTGRTIPNVLDYTALMNSPDKMFNTPPVFPIYVSLLVLRWIKDSGGIPAMEIHNKHKASMLYEELDRNPLFSSRVQKEDRSIMNAYFNTQNETLRSEFIKYAHDRGCIGIAGHRETGGFRVSMYNAMKVEGIQQLITLMQEFEQDKG